MHVLATSGPDGAWYVDDHPDGGRWTHYLHRYDLPDGSPESDVFADSATDLVAALITGYDAFPLTEQGDEDALIARYEHALMVAATAQGALVQDAIVGERFSIDTASEDVLTALFQDRLIPFEERTWDQPVALVLIATDYAPFTSRPRPEGLVIWLDPSVETAYLRSLDTIGMIDYRVAESN